MYINELEIFSDDINETKRFYTDVLGFSEIHSDKNKAIFKTNDSILIFKRSHKLQPQYHFAFNIPCNKIEEAAAWVSARTELINIEEDKSIANFVSWNAKAIYFFDNNGNILEFIARYDLDNATDKPFGNTSILNISEIGLVTDEPLQLADKLVKENHLCYFSKGTVSETFITIGDDNGLFIIVKTNRIWYPTSLPAKKCFARVKICNEEMYYDIVVNR